MRGEKTREELHADRKLGRVLAELRKHANLTQVEVASRIGTSQSHISEIESGAGLEVYRLRRIVRALGYDINIVIERRYET